MDFLDEKIAELQKEAYREKKHSEINSVENEKIEEENINEISQEEVSKAISNGFLKINEEELLFERKTCFEGKVVIPILKDFFDEFQENEILYCWTKKQKLSIIAAKLGADELINTAEDLKEKIRVFFKENEIYTELLESREEVNENYHKYIITSRTPTALDYIYQYIIYLKLKDEMFSVTLTCLEEDIKQWEKIMIGIGELIEINEGEIEE
ncbi:hypothetical protein B0P06_004277 [Clostridium saccharoperbutylacetonicum]|uniref:Uncharacterized protein n=1 Tax=Clostridium saccharoperbutylacetonicum N1-4(HMT) TaxID=931276 RepID=M1MHM5_9CLOT|nr:hypothetical protein [Clostridium saccharoperbutylacetonicum]AGF57424.1 hypothetical protein Cspa_c36640 [Clostridium saccharoperbutylacetonicum N1-4(HMT)]NRT61810.1 hypothetical protein [Clostridium saccharoperbutylacetonicum]NSB25135.1 hypothetical protein [Clostridium saccharoperbutylacetonicum]NSB44506.1 hypothetical protein [Clostridium saccharoperbutylacetonicum]